MGDARLGLRLLFWGAGARSGVLLVQSAWYRSERGLSRFSFSGGGGDWSLREVLDYGVPIFLQLAALGAMVLMVIGAWRLARGATDRARPFLLAATAGLALALVAHLPNAAFSLKLVQRSNAPWLLELTRWAGAIGLIVWTLAGIALLLGMQRLAKRTPWLAGGALVTLWVWDVVYWLVLIRWLGFPLHDNHWRLLITGVDVAQTCLLLVLLDGLASSLESKPGPPVAEWGQNAGWQLAADGLRSYTTALMGRIFVPLGLLLLAAFGLAVRIFALAATAAIAMPFLVVLFSIWMLIGIKRFADFVPAETEARSTAGVAVKLMIAAALLDGIVLIVMLIMFVDHSALEHAQETAALSSSTAQLLGVIGVFILLGAFRRIGDFIGIKDIERRVRTSAILIGLTSVLANQLSLGTQDTARLLRHVDAEFVLILVVALVLAIASLVVYIGLLKRLRDAIVDGTVAAVAAATAAATPRRSAL